LPVNSMCGCILNPVTRATHALRANPDGWLAGLAEADRRASTDALQEQPDE